MLTGFWPCIESNPNAETLGPSVYFTVTPALVFSSYSLIGKTSDSTNTREGLSPKERDTAAHDSMRVESIMWVRIPPRWPYEISW